MHVRAASCKFHLCLTHPPAFFVLQYVLLRTSHVLSRYCQMDANWVSTANFGILSCWMKDRRWRLRALGFEMPNFNREVIPNFACKQENLCIFANCICLRSVMGPAFWLVLCACPTREVFSVLADRTWLVRPACLVQVTVYCPYLCNVCKPYTFEAFLLRRLSNQTRCVGRLLLLHATFLQCFWFAIGDTIQLAFRHCHISIQTRLLLARKGALCILLQC